MQFTKRNNKKDDDEVPAPAEMILKVQIFSGFILPRCAVKVLAGWVENLIGIYPISMAR